MIVQSHYLAVDKIYLFPSLISVVKFDALIALSSRYPVDKNIHVKAGRITWPGHMQVR